MHISQNTHWPGLWGEAVPLADPFPQTHIDYGSQLAPVHVAVVVFVVHLEGPAQFVLQVSSENEIERCHKLQEIYGVVLKGRRGATPSHFHIRSKMRDVTAVGTSSSSHPVSVESSEHVLGVFGSFPRRVHAEETLELVQEKPPAGTLHDELLVHVLNCFDVDLLNVLRLLRLPHDLWSNGP